MAAAGVDVGYIAGHLGLDQPVVVSLTTEPTVDLVSALLRAVATKAHEFETLYAEKLQTDIELENAVRSSESKSQTFKSTADKALHDVGEARQRLKEEETKRQSLENELQILKAKYSDYDAEVTALGEKIETLQSSNRTNLGIIEANNKRDQALTDELTKQHQRNVDLSREVTTLQQSEQNAKGQLNSAKFRQEALQQQLDLARQNAEWLENELKTKSDEGLRYRKEKAARIAELERQNEDLQSQIDTSNKTMQQLRDRLLTTQSKADDALVKLQKQEGSFASTVESYKQELEDQRRLVDMSNQLSKKHQGRVRELDGEKERLKDNYENELRRVRLELESERRDTKEMEERIHQLETELDETQARIEHAPAQSAPETPRPNGSLPGRAGSPFATPSSVRNKSAITATQAIEQLFQVKGQLASERRRNQQLTEELDSMMTALEAKAPEIQELQSESDTLRTQITRMSELSQLSFEERDGARKAARRAESALATTQSETKILRTQLRDLGTQIQMLVFNLYAMEKGEDQLTEEEKLRMRQLERGEISEEALSDMSDTHQFITQKLVVFKNIKSLQAKNEELLRITRELAEQLESEEALAAKHKAKEDHDMVERLKLDLTHMAEEIKSAKITMESYKTERDIFRRLLQQRGVPDDVSVMDGRLPLASIEGGEQGETLNEALRRLQSEYDGYRDAQDGVRKDFKEQIDHLTSEKSSLQAANIKAQGEAKLEFERREMLQSNYAALQQENDALQKRNQALSETAAKQDVRTQQVAEELIEAKGLLDSMRSETMNLKAEKNLSKGIQERITKDNDSLIEEKNRLANLLAAHQSLENERNLSESELRRKSSARIDGLEIELSTAQKRLSQAVDESQRLQQRKEFEAKEAQKRIDDLMTSLGQVREELIGAKTSRDHLQARVDELSVELRSAEDRVGRLQPRPTPRPGVGGENDQRLQELEAENSELSDEVRELQRDLQLAKTQLHNAELQVEQFKELSRSNEEALEYLRTSEQEYRDEVNILIEEKDAKTKELGQKIDDVSTELSRSNSELSALRDSQNQVARKFEDEKAIFEEEVKRLKDESTRHLEAARYHQQDLRAQADIATKAQQDYEKELVKHAEAAKMVQQLRTEYNQLKSESSSLRAEADSAKAALVQSEGSWEERREQLEREMAGLKQRREDADTQNKLLHQQLESLTVQVSALQHSRNAATADGDEVVASVDAGEALDGMRELNSYLRREKEILEVQYDMKLQEAKRLQQQTDYLQSQLDEARLKLDQERSQASQSGSTSLAHQNLMEKLNELNLYRESSMALRSENGQLKDQIVEKNNKIDEMTERVQPLENEIENLKTQKSFLEEEIKQIQEDRDRWQKRTEGILTKYGRVDPAEMDELKSSITAVEAERDALREAQQPLSDKVAELETSLETERANWVTLRGKLTEQFKDRSRKITGDKNEAVQRANTLQEQLDKAKEDLAGSLKQAEQSAQEKVELSRQVLAFREQVEQLRRQVQDSPSETAQASSAVVTELEQHLAAARRELEAVGVQKANAEQQLEKLRNELDGAISERDNALQKLQDAALVADAVEAEPGQVTQAADNETQQQVSAGLSGAERSSFEQRIAAAEARASEFEHKANDVEAKIQQTIKERSDRMRDTLNNKLKESRAKLEEEYKQKDANLHLRFEQEKLIWRAENGGPAQAASTETPTTEAPAPEQQQQQQQPMTPAKADRPPTPGTPATTTASAPADLTQMDDTSIRQFLASNATVKSIIAANLRKKLDLETVRLKSEYEGKITAAREQAQLMESKKSTLRINMAENKLRGANAKLGVVETAARQTPQRPVVEVWEVAKSTQAPPPAAAAAAAPAPSPAPTPAAASAAAPAAAPTPAAATVAAAPMSSATATAKAAPARLPAPPAVPFTGTTSSQAQTGSLKPPQPPLAAASQAAESEATATDSAAAKAPHPSGLPAPPINNPFAVTAEASSGSPNPFTAQPQAGTATTAQPAAAHNGPSQQQQPQPQLPQRRQLPPQVPPPVRSGIPMPRGGGRGRGGASTVDVGGAQAGRGGRGGARGGRGGMNPAASDFQPGSKRPRGGEAEAGAGVKRPRGAH